MKKLLSFLFKKCLYTSIQVQNMIINISNATVLGTFDYIKSDHVFIKQKSSGKHIKNAELSRDNDKGALSKFVNHRLNEIGIKVNEENL